MRDIQILTKQGYIEGVDTVEISLLSLTKFLFVYPEIFNNGKVVMSDLGKVLQKIPEDSAFFVTQEPLQKIYEAVLIWVRHVIGTSVLNKQYTRINLFLDLSVDGIPCHLPQQSGELETEVQALMNSHAIDLLVRPLSNDLLVTVKEVLNPAICHNIYLAKKLDILMFGGVV